MVSDSLTNEPLPFVNVVFEGKNIGTTTDMDGRFILESQWGSETLLFSSLGYAVKRVSISREPAQRVNVRLVPQVQMLEAVEIVQKKRRYRNKNNPAVDLVTNVLDHKDENRGYTFNYFQFDKYTKSQYDVNNFTKEWLESRVLRGFEVMGNYIDTSELNGKPFVPILMQEKLSTVYQRNHGRDQVEVVEASQLSGIDDANFTSGVDQFMSKIGGDVDIYDNKILLFDKSFTSPISPIGKTIYRYYITDSTKVDGVWKKKISFMPRNATQIAFTGFMWVGDSTLNYGVEHIELNIDKRMNINFLDDFRITQEFEQDSVLGWHKVKDIMIVDFQPIGRAMGIFNTKTTSYNNFRVNKPSADTLFNGVNSVVYLDTEESKTDSFWTSNRHDSLSLQEEEIFVLADTIQNIKQFKTYNKMLHLFVTGYLDFKKIEFGPLTSLGSYNTVEGFRTRAGFITNARFHKKWRFSGFAAYGFTDQRFKYMTKAEYYFRKKPFRRLEIGYIDNTFQPGFAVNSIPQDHFFLSFRRSPTTNMFYEKMFKVIYDHEWVPGFMNSLEVSARNLESTRFNPMIYAVTKDTLSSLQDNTITLKTRFSKDGKVIQGDFRRYYVKTPAPVYTLNYTYSGKWSGSNYEYHKFELGISKRFMLGILGFSDVDVEAYKLFGKVPYPLLIIHKGNESISYDAASYNMMNFMEFASDESVGIRIEHHFNGLIFGYFPLLNRSKIRLVISGKALIGKVSAENQNFEDPELILKPERLREIGTTPYAEGSIGVENIFNIFRVDLVKRFTYLEAENIGNFMGVKGLAPRIAFKFKF